MNSNDAIYWKESYDAEVEKCNYYIAQTEKLDKKVKSIEAEATYYKQALWILIRREGSRVTISKKEQAGVPENPVFLPEIDCFDNFVITAQRAENE